MRYWRAFDGTDADRPVGLAAGLIPSSAIIQWMRDVEGETDPAELARAVRMVRAIDDESLPMRRENRAAQE